MATALGLFTAGSYIGTYKKLGGSAVAYGCIEGPARLSVTPHVDPIRCDQFGDMVVDGVFRGVSGRLVVTFKEWKAVIREAIWPYVTSAATSLGYVGLVGRSPTADFGGEIVLTAATGTRAAVNGPATFTFHQCIPTPGQESLMELGNVQRDIAVSFDLIPVVDGDADSPEQLKLFTVTDGSGATG